MLQCIARSSRPSGEKPSSTARAIAQPTSARLPWADARRAIWRSRSSSSTAPSQRAALTRDSTAQATSSITRRRTAPCAACRSAAAPRNTSAHVAGKTMAQSRKQAPIPALHSAGAMASSPRGNRDRASRLVHAAVTSRNVPAKPLSG